MIIIIQVLMGLLIEYNYVDHQSAFFIKETHILDITKIILH